MAAKNLIKGIQKKITKAGYRADIAKRLATRCLVLRRSFTLLEVLVAITVLAFIVVITGQIFVSLKQAWRRQRATINLVQNSRWAMERMVNEIRQGSNIDTSPPGPIASGRGIRFRPFPGPPSPFVWYWRGNGGVTGNINILYRGTGANFGGPGGADTNRQELANLVVNNPLAPNDLVDNLTGLAPNDFIQDPNFIFNAGLLAIELTFRPIPAQPASRENQDFTVWAQIRPRN